ncbi:MAG: ABC transporter substrate-binding protein [Myxococcota bacterium]
MDDTGARRLLGGVLVALATLSLAGLLSAAVIVDAVRRTWPDPTHGTRHDRCGGEPNERDARPEPAEPAPHPDTPRRAVEAMLAGANDTWTEARWFVQVSPWLEPRWALRMRTRHVACAEATEQRERGPIRCAALDQLVLRVVAWQVARQLTGSDRFAFVSEEIRERSYGRVARVRTVAEAGGVTVDFIVAEQTDDTWLLRDLAVDSVSLAKTTRYELAKLHRDEGLPGLVDALRGFVTAAEAG